ncbi:hypothetical protein FUAX_55080 (plasmid) [Fulvitalea axinellae]|uniref:Lipoprotein n=1 Tax=Fulvitalea axinellae TaxID=1182444 RepID=A0AAU9DIW7_9BACT|nr:hypothetical protein FUAX_55080 [Fulvitalea axinellae]
MSKLKIFFLSVIIVFVGGCLYVLSIFDFFRPKYLNNRFKTDGFQTRMLKYVPTQRNCLFLKNRDNSDESSFLLELRPTVSFHSDSTKTIRIGYIRPGSDGASDKISYVKILGKERNTEEYVDITKDFYEQEFHYTLDSTLEHSGTSVVSKYGYVSLPSIDWYINKYNNRRLIGNVTPQREILLIYTGSLEIMDVKVEVFKEHSNKGDSLISSSPVMRP